MHQPQRDDPSKQPKTNQEVDQLMIGELAESIVEALRESVQKEKDPFESYADELRLRLHTNVKVFRGQLIQGYKVLMETVEMF